MTLWSTFFAVSFALLAWLGRPLVEAFGVPTLFAAHGGIMAGLAVLLTAMTRRDMIADRLDMPRLSDLPGLHLGIYRSARLFAPAAGWLFYTFCFVSMLTVLPPYIVESNRSFVMAAMPLMGMAASMTLGVILLRWLSAVRVVQLGFALSAVASVWLWVDTGAPMACLVVAGAMGLVQGGSFAAIAQLNQSAPDRALASGAMAQTGNLGNTIGTPIMVLVLYGIGYGGMMAVLIAMFAGGLAVHTLLARRV